MKLETKSKAKSACNKWLLESMNELESMKTKNKEEQRRKNGKHRKKWDKGRKGPTRNKHQDRGINKRGWTGNSCYRVGLQQTGEHTKQEGKTRMEVETKKAKTWKTARCNRELFPGTLKELGACSQTSCSVLGLYKSLYKLIVCLCIF